MYVIMYGTYSKYQDDVWLLNYEMYTFVNDVLKADHRDFKSKLCESWLQKDGVYENDVTY